jgi:hypothetical protein
MSSGKIGYVIAYSNRDAAIAAEQNGWIMGRSGRWSTPEGYFIKLAPDGYDFADLAKQHVCYFVPGWEKRRDSTEIAYGIGMAGCKTYWVSGEAFHLDEAYVKRVAMRAAS